MKQNKKAFTLAEVLITLAVIGVVAALTIPSLMQSNQKQSWIMGYKTTFNTIKQATIMVRTDNGGTLAGAWSGDAEMYDKYKDHLKVVKECEGSPLTAGCFASEYKVLSYDYTMPVSGDRSVILANGVSVAFDYKVANSSDIFIDINGIKPPNEAGKDMHIILINIKEPVQPFSYNSDYETFIKPLCQNNLTSVGDPMFSGLTCGVRILMNDYGTEY